MVLVRVVNFRAGPVMPNFISIRIFKRFLKENLNFIINSFQIKHGSFKKMAEYWRNLRGILARNGPARPSPLKFAGRNGPARFVKPEIYDPGLSHHFSYVKIHIFNIF